MYVAILSHEEKGFPAIFTASLNYISDIWHWWKALEASVSRLSRRVGFYNHRLIRAV